MPLPSTPVYSITNTYSKGSLATSLYSATAFDSAKTPAVSFLSVDNDVDATGLVSTSRDSAGIATAFTYDTSGRLTETRQKNAQNTTVSAITSYSYGSATSSA